MTRALQHAYSEYMQDEGNGGDREVFVGHLRIVRNPRRVRLLKRRGVEIDGPYTSPGVRYWCWFETDESYDRRAKARKAARALARKIRDCKREHGLDWMHALMTDVFGPRVLAAHLQEQLRERGYAIELGVVTPGDRARRVAPPLTLYVFDDIEVDLE